MPVVISQDELDLAHIQKWVNFIHSKLKANAYTSCKMKTVDRRLYHVKKSETSGCYFLTKDLYTIDYLYAYTSVSVQGEPKAAEALAYLMEKTLRGVTREVLFDHLLPRCKFVVTDSLYTPDGERWFHAAYTLAFAKKYKVYALDLKRNLFLKVNRQEFDFLLPSFWGRSSSFQTYRFAIALK
jgi:hypothetical protein